jgi:NAD(P)-dependent dehydrogenase (short-subunit alcohol dehydrogenase family)
MNYLNRKVALVTGSSKGIEAEIARQLADAEAAVILNYPSDKSVADKILKAITGEGDGPWLRSRRWFIFNDRQASTKEPFHVCLLSWFRLQAHRLPSEL